jgi:CheY-like chemotaxis protein
MPLSQFASWFSECKKLRGYASQQSVFCTAGVSSLEGYLSVRRQEDALPLRVLVVDDDCSVRVGLLRMLRAHGYDVIGASGGSEALEKALAWPPDVVLMDLMMPFQSGPDAARNMRNQPPLADTPIIALTASPNLPAEANMIFQTVLTKPCSSTELLSAITKAVDGRT